MKQFIEKLRNLSETKKYIILFLIVGSAALMGGFLVTRMMVRDIAKLSQSAQSINLGTKQNEAMQRQSEEPKDEMAGWQTYTNTEYGFEVKYPGDWQVMSSSEFKNSATNSDFQVIKNDNNKNLDLDAWFQEATNINGRPTVKAAAMPVSVNGVKVYKIYSDLESPNPYFEIVGIANEQNEIFSIYAYSGVKTDNEILEKILSTFKFKN